MFSKKNIDEIDSNILVFFFDLSHYLYFHQLYRAFVMLIKKWDFSDEEYLDDEMKVSKIMIIFMLWIFNTWLI